MTKQTHQTPPLSKSPTCADEVSPEASIGIGRTKIFQY